MRKFLPRPGRDCLGGVIFKTEGNEEKMGEKKTYKVVSPIRHNGKRYEEGATIELLNEEAIALAKAKAIVSLDGSKLPGDKAVEDIEAFKATIAELNAKISERDSIIAGQKRDLESAQKSVASLQEQLAESQAQKGKGKK